LPHADAHRRDAVPAVATLELAQQRSRGPRARRPDRMTDRDGTAVRVGAILRQPKRAHARDHLRGKRLVQLDRVAFPRRDAGAFDQLAHGRDRTEPHVIRMHAGRRAGHHAAERAEPEGLGLLARRDDERGRAIVDARGVAGGHGAAVLEGGLQLSELLEGGARARMLVLADELGAVVHGLDLAGDEAISSRVRLSTPPAMTRSASSARIRRAASFTASRPLPQSRFTVTPGTVSGSPARSDAIRPTLRLSSPAWFDAPNTTSSISESPTSVRSSTARMTCDARSSGRIVESAPAYRPNGVRAKPRITASRG